MNTKREHQRNRGLKAGRTARTPGGRKGRRRGYTLTEMICVISLLGLLLSMAGTLFWAGNRESRFSLEHLGNAGRAGAVFGALRRDIASSARAEIASPEGARLLLFGSPADSEPRVVYTLEKGTLLHRETGPEGKAERILALDVRSFRAEAAPAAGELVRVWLEWDAPPEEDGFSPVWRMAARTRVEVGQ